MKSPKNQSIAIKNKTAKIFAIVIAICTIFLAVWTYQYFQTKNQDEGTGGRFAAALSWVGQVNNTTYRTMVSVVSPQPIPVRYIKWYVNDENNINIASGYFPQINGSSVSNNDFQITWVGTDPYRGLSLGDIIYIHTERVINATYDNPYSFKLTWCFGPYKAPLASLPSIYLVLYIFGVCVFSGGIFLFILGLLGTNVKTKTALLILSVVLIIIGLYAMFHTIVVAQYDYFDEYVICKVYWGNV